MPQGHFLWIVALIATPGLCIALADQKGKTSIISRLYERKPSYENKGADGEEKGRLATDFPQEPLGGGGGRARSVTILKQSSQQKSHSA